MIPKKVTIASAAATSERPAKACGADGATRARRNLGDAAMTNALAMNTSDSGGDSLPVIETARAAPGSRGRELGH